MGFRFLIINVKPIQDDPGSEVKESCGVPQGIYHLYLQRIPGISATA